MIISSGRGRLDSSAISDRDLIQLIRLNTPPAGALVAATTTRLKIPAMDGFSTAKFNPSAAVALADRVLLFGPSPATVGIIFSP
nr:hypothetical protein [uncultured Roseateles sp.]